MNVEAEISCKEQLRRDARACSELLRRLLRFHPEQAPAHLRRPAKPGAVRCPASGPCNTVSIILRAVAAHYGVTPTDLTTKGRRAAIAEPRQVAIFLARQLTKFSLAQIAKPFGRRDHTTILYAVKKIERRRRYDPERARVLGRLAAQVKSRKRQAA
jgi:chromosomal replication initiation ATPase DnaA